MFKGVGRIRNYQHLIRLIEDWQAVVLPIRTREQAEQSVEGATFDKLLEIVILEKSGSAWAANDVFVPEKDGIQR